jgi:hypothetical protein
VNDSLVGDLEVVVESDGMEGGNRWMEVQYRREGT